MRDSRFAECSLAEITYQLKKVKKLTVKAFFPSA
jgi:hypothetical protein